MGWFLFIYLTGYLFAYFFIKRLIKNEFKRWTNNDRFQALVGSLLSWIAPLVALLAIRSTKNEFYE